ncbi:MAG: DoxX family protein [Planctomycetales bacterium]|nr:DoxX family protein [Planctomycetales bacterium]
MDKKHLGGWIVSGLIAAFLLFSASGKFRDFEGKEEMFAHLGWTVDVMQKVGVVEIAATVLYLVPQTSFLGAILLTGYLGGATAAHVRIGDPFFFPPLLGVVMWIGYALRRPDVVLAAFRAPSSKATD